MKSKLYIALVLSTLFISCNQKSNNQAGGSFEATEIIVSAEANGIIMDLNVSEGELIEANYALGFVDTTMLSLQKQQLILKQKAILANRPDIQIQVAALREQISKLKSEKLRIDNLLKDGAATSKQRDDIVSQINVAEQQLKASLSSISNNVESINSNAAVIDNQIEQIQNKIEKSIIKSSIEGTVLAKYTEAGEVTMQGKPILKVADIKRMYLRAYFTSAQIANLKIGEELTVISDFGGDNKSEYVGTVQWIAAESEFTPKNIQTDDSRSNLVYAVKIAVNNSKGLIKIGTHGCVIL